MVTDIYMQSLYDDRLRSLCNDKALGWQYTVYADIRGGSLEKEC